VTHNAQQVQAPRRESLQYTSAMCCTSLVSTWNSQMSFKWSRLRSPANIYKHRCVCTYTKLFIIVI